MTSNLIEQLDALAWKLRDIRAAIAEDADYRKVATGEQPSDAVDGALARALAEVVEARRLLASRDT